MVADRKAADRAGQLLRSLLDGEQLSDLERRHGFRVRAGERLYWVPLRGKPSAVRLTDGLIEHYCVDVDRRRGMPLADVAISLLLWIKADGNSFHTQANVTARSRARGSLDESDALNYLVARPGRDQPPRRSRTQSPSSCLRVPCYPPVHLTDSERAAISMKLKALRVEFKVASLRRHLGGYPDQALHGLARRLVNAT